MGGDYIEPVSTVVVQQHLVACSSNNKKIRATESISEPPNCTIDDLTNGLLVEILHRLPCKFANQCKCVSKRWHVLISDPYFVRRFLSHQRNMSVRLPSSIVFQYPNSQRKKEIFISSKESVFKSRGFSVSFLSCFGAQDKKDPVYVIASYKDLLLCTMCSASLLFHSIYYICNPVTMQWVALPPPPHCHKKVHIGFTCDPYYGEDEGGHSFIVNTQYRYKVVRILEFENSSSSSVLNMEMFCSESGEWSELVVSCPKGFRSSMVRKSAVALNGVLYWKILVGSKIVGYDPYNKQCHFIDMPERWKKGLIGFGASRGNLRMSQLLILRSEFDEDDHQTAHLKVWELKDTHTGKGKWYLEHKVYLNELVSQKSWLAKYVNNNVYALTVLNFHPNDGDIVYLFVQFLVVRCNMRTKKLKLIRNLRDAIDLYTGTVLQLVLPWWPTPVS